MAPEALLSLQGPICSTGGGGGTWTKKLAWHVGDVNKAGWGLLGAWLCFLCAQRRASGCRHGAAVGAWTQRLLLGLPRLCSALLCVHPRWWRRSLCCPSCTASWSTAGPPPTLPSATPSPTRSARRCWRSWTAVSRSAGTCLLAGALPPRLALSCWAVSLLQKHDGVHLRVSGPPNSPWHPPGLCFSGPQLHSYSSFP